MKEIEGNIITLAKHHQGIIVQQGNCQNVCGAGLAGAIAKTWPEWAKAFRAQPGVLGRYWLWSNGEVTIATIYGQKNYGRDPNIVYTSYDHFAWALVGLSKHLTMQEYRTRYKFVPKGIGCGLANGKWERIYPMLCEYLPDAHLVTYKP